MVSVPVANDCVEEVEPLREVMPVAGASSQEIPFAAVDEAVRTRQFAPTPRAAQVAPFAVMRFPVVVARLFMSLILPGKFHVSVEPDPVILNPPA